MLETNEQSSNSSRTVEEILGAHPINNDDFWGNTNPTDVSINTATSEEMMMRSHITEFHTSKQEEPVITELLNKASNVPGLIHKHGASGRHHNQSDGTSAKPTDYKLNTRKDGSFPPNIVGKEDVTKVMGKTHNMVEGFINDMLPKSSRLQAPTTVDNINNNSVERANTVLKANNILGAHVMEEKEE